MTVPFGMPVHSAWALKQRDPASDAAGVIMRHEQLWGSYEKILAGLKQERADPRELDQLTIDQRSSGPGTL
jgi:hypothetical protein